MLHDLVRWVLHSPARLVATTAVVLLIPALGWVAIAPGGEARPGEAREVIPVSRASAPATPTSSPVPTETTASGRVLRLKSIEFLAEYVVAPAAPAPAGVSADLRELSTPALWRGLRRSDPALLPRGKVSAVEVEDLGSFGGTVLADVGTTWLVVSLVAWDEGWRVSDIRPAEE